MGFSGQEHWSGLPFPSPGDPLTRYIAIFVSHLKCFIIKKSEIQLMHNVVLVSGIQQND